MLAYWEAGLMREPAPPWDTTGKRWPICASFFRRCSVDDLAELKAQLEAHKAQRPDHLKAMAPHAPTTLRQDWQAWCHEKWRLERAIEDCKFRTSHTWRAPSGAYTRPAWAGNALVPMCKPLKPESHKRDPRTVDQLIDALEAMLDELSALTPGTEPWETKRTEASKFRARVTRRVKDEELRIEIPYVPRLSDLQPRQSQHRKEWDAKRKRESYHNKKRS